jgi:hypothetical protein
LARPWFVRSDAFFVEQPADGAGRRGRRQFNSELVDRVRRAPLDDHDDVEIAVALARLVHDELELYGTCGGEELDQENMRLALQALRRVVDRTGAPPLQLEFRDYSSFRTWWIREGAHGTWQGRRELLDDLFNPLHDALADLEAGSIASTLADPITPHGRTGWAAVDAEVAELRRHFQTARTPQDYRNVGNDCVIVTEAISRHAYSSDRHLRAGENEPPVDKTKLRLDRVIEDALPGPENAALRKLARSVIEFAQEVKHRTAPTRREAGIAADAVIQLANMMRRLEEPE